MKGKKDKLCSTKKNKTDKCSKSIMWSEFDSYCIFCSGFISGENLSISSVKGKLNVGKYIVYFDVFLCKIASHSGAWTMDNQLVAEQFCRRFTGK